MLFSKWTLLVVLIVIGSPCLSQELIVPYEGGVPTSLECYAITVRGDSIYGKPVSSFGTTRGLRKINILTASGEKKSLSADELSRVGFKNNGLVKTLSVLEKSTSIKKISTTNWKQVFNRQYIVYERATLPSGKKNVLMQTLNPGFDSRIKIFYSNGSRKTWGVGVPLPTGIAAGPASGSRVRLTGDLQRVYWISKDGGKVFKVKKGKYNKKKFKKIFGDSPEMLDAFGRPYQFRSFPEHVFFYDRLANKN